MGVSIEVTCMTHQWSLLTDPDIDGCINDTPTVEVYCTGAFSPALSEISGNERGRREQVNEQAKGFFMGIQIRESLLPHTTQHYRELCCQHWYLRVEGDHFISSLYMLARTLILSSHLSSLMSHFEEKEKDIRERERRERESHGTFQRFALLLEARVKKEMKAKPVGFFLLYFSFFLFLSLPLTLHVHTNCSYSIK